MDNDDGLHGGIVAGPWILNHLHRADEVRLDITQFVQVGQLAIIQVNQRRTFSENLIAFTFLRDGRHPREHIFGRAQSLHHRTLHVHHQRIALQLHLRPFALHHHTLDDVVVRMHPDGTHFGPVAEPVNGLVSDAGNAGQDSPLPASLDGGRSFVGDSEIPAFI